MAEVKAVTAEPGNVKERLLKRDDFTSALDYPIESDPEHKLLFGNKADWFLVETHTGFDETGPYEMVQPALMVYDVSDSDNKKKLVPELSWSWKTISDSKDAMSRVPSENAKKEEGVLLVTQRPVLSDLAAAIQEKRAVKLASTHPEW